MADSRLPTWRNDDNQTLQAHRALAQDIGRLLTPGEEILCVASQSPASLALIKDSVAATSNRLIYCSSHLLGRREYKDYLWEDVLDVRLKEGILTSELTADLANGRSATLGGLDKQQARRLYGACQQKEQEWREKRRIRQIEEDRARAGGVYMTSPTQTSPAEDPVAKLARAKQMLDQQLISEAEYEALKAKIIAEM